MLTGMQQINAPIPLGGTSNHFKTSALLELGGWDAFNVTEDADLGIRLVKQGYKTQILDSTTLEEANSNLKNWFWQRSRWIKGYIQTYLVHTRDLKAFRTEKKWNLNAVKFQLIIGGKVLSMLINPIMWLLTISYFALRPIVGPTIQSLFPMTVLYIGVVSLIFGNFLYMYYYMVGCARRQHYGLIKYALFIPLYWLAMSAAAYYGLIEFMYKPHHWRKTKHGLHLELAKPAMELET
jgi:cellulose synthase/poly-beta-1,6-N-acetylglucosamine synthase-like glycosyltransferase